MGQRTRAQRLNGLFPLSYTGVVPVSPINFVIDDRPPTVEDSKNFYIGDLWLNSTPTPPGPGDVWMLTSLDGNTATWVNFGGSIGSLTFQADDATTAVPAGGIIKMLSADAHLSTTAAGNSVFFDIGDAIAAQYTADVGVATPVAANLNVFGSTNIDTTGAADTITINLAPDVIIQNNLEVTNDFTVDTFGTGVLVSDGVGAISSINGTDGQVIIAATGADPLWANLTAGAGISITNGANSISIAATGGGSFVSTLTGDVGGAVSPLAGNIDILGSALVTVTGTPAMNKLEITLSGHVPSQFATNAGTAVPALGILNIVGSNGITTSGAGSTVTINGGNPIKTVTGNSGGALGPTAGNVNIVGTNVITTAGAGSTLTASLTNGTNGQVLIGGGAQPTWANITSTGGTVAITNGPNTINLESTAGVSGSGSFLAYLSTDFTIGDAGQTPPYTYYMGTRQALTVLYDTAGLFYPGDGINNPATFTAPATGKYFITWTGMTEHTSVPGNTINGYPMLGFLSPSINLAWGVQQSSSNATINSPTEYSGTISAVLDLTIGDTVQFTYVTVFTNGGVSDFVRFKSVREAFFPGSTTYYSTFISGYRVA